MSYWPPATLLPLLTTLDHDRSCDNFEKSGQRKVITTHAGRSPPTTRRQTEQPIPTDTMDSSALLEPDSPKTSSFDNSSGMRMQAPRSVAEPELREIMHQERATFLSQFPAWSKDADFYQAPPDTTQVWTHWRALVEDAVLIHLDSCTTTYFDECCGGCADSTVVLQHAWPMSGIEWGDPQYTASRSQKADQVVHVHRETRRSVPHTDSVSHSRTICQHRMLTQFSTHVLSVCTSL